MFSKKTGPAPIFNCRKRLRQAVVADPETHPPQLQGNKSVGVHGHSPQLMLPTSSRPPRGRRTGSPCDSSMYMPSVGKPTPLSSETQQSKAWGTRITENQRPPRPMAQQNAGSRKGSWSSRQPTVTPAKTNPSSTIPWQQSLYQPSHSRSCGEDIAVTAASIPVSSSHSNKPTAGNGQAKTVAMASDTSLRVLTLPLAQLKHVFGLHSDTMPQLLFHIYGIVDSATLTDNATGGKSFTLRDETGRIRCVFCEIDRQLPNLRRGQWYRVVGVLKPSWQALQCLSVRPASLVERKAASALTSRSASVLDDIRRACTEP